MDLNTTWFLLIAVLFAGYAILDGFDLGVGVLHLFARSERERRINVKAIGPVWDGNEVWLLTAGGALFAAFPPVYATVFSGFYLALMLLLLGLIMRAVSLEFRHGVESPGWRRAWDLAFGLGSLIPALLLGVAAANILAGLPLAEDGTNGTTFLGLLTPYTLLFGLMGLAILVMHGACYMTLKTGGELQKRMGRIAAGAWVAGVSLFAAVAMGTFFWAPDLLVGVGHRILLWLFLALVLGAVAYIPVGLQGERYGRAFLASSLLIGSFIGLLATCLFPVMVPSTLAASASLTVYNASSTPGTLRAMLIIALIAVPVVLLYTAVIYRIFAGKVQVDDEGY